MKNAQAIAKFEQDYYAGSAAVTRNQFGKGIAFYVGTMPDQSGMDWLMEQVCKTANVKPVSSNTPVGVEILQRVNGDSSFLFLLNHSNEKVNVPFNGHGCNLLTDTDVIGSVELEPSGVAVIQLDEAK